MILLNCDWQGVINELPCLCKWIIIPGALLIAFRLLCYYCILPIIKNCHEKNGT